MEIYLIQHGLANNKEQDPERHLSEEGLNAVSRVAARVAELGLELGPIYHSGKVRAHETADILADALNRKLEVQYLAGLNPKDPVAPIQRWLQDRAADGQGVLTLVGHLPLLDRLTAVLVTGSEACSVIAFENGGLVKLSPDTQRPGQYLIRWVLTPMLC